MNEKNYYDEKINEIKGLINSQKFQEAFAQIETELNMPYVPSIYEKEFKDLYARVKSMLINDNQQVKIASREEVVEMLFSENEDIQAIALESLPEHNLRLVKESLKRRIETWDKNEKLKKAYLFEQLIDQEIDIEIEFTEDLKLNPAKTESVLSDIQVFKMIEQIDLLTIKSPALTETAKQEAKRYLLLTYPNIPSSGQDFALWVVNIAKYMFGQNVKLSNQEQDIYKVLKGN